MSKKGTVRIYGAGGAGCNAVAALNLPNDAAGFPESHFTLVDTSGSNIPRTATKPWNTYLIPGIDGSGKNRPFAYKVAKPHMDSILLESPPMDFNIVIFGLSGGSGSVLGPLLLAEILRRGSSCIGICVISTASAKETKNAFDTLGTLINMSTQTLKKPIVCCFHENTRETPRAEVDFRIENQLRALAMLACGHNDELDRKDLGNWLDYTKVTTITPQLVDLVVHIPKADAAVPDITAITVANLLADKDTVELDLGQLYSCVGYLNKTAIESTTLTIPSMHYIVTNGHMEERLSSLSAKIAEYEASEKLLAGTPVAAFKTDSPDGFVF